jgi:hypothetical protein
MNDTSAGRELFTNMKSFVDGLPDSDSAVVYPAAMMYQMDKAAYSSYGQRACDCAYYQIKDPNGSLYSPGQWQNVSGQGRYNAWVVAVAYDWANDKCSSAQLSAFAAFMADYYAYHKDHYYGMWTDQTGTYYVPRDNKFVGILRNNAEMAIAIYDPSAHLEGATWLSEIAAIFNSAVVPYLTDPGAQPPYANGFGGSTSEGSSYGSETQTEYGDLFWALTTGTDTDFWALAPNFALDTLHYQIAIAGPTTAKSFYGPRLPYGDDDTQGTELYYQQYMAMLRVTDHLRLAGDSTNAAYGQWWINNVFDYGSLHPWSEFSTERFFYYSPAAIETSYAAAAPDYLTPFMLVSRSDWTAGATWVSFMAMEQGADHEHGNAGMFQVYRRGIWLTMDPKVYMSNEPIGVGSTGHNAPLLNFHGSATALTGGSLDWARFSRTASGYRGECNASAGYCYAQADMSGVYRVRDSGQGETPDVKSATRDFLYLKPDLVVVSDRFKYIDGLSAMSVSNLRAEALPTVSGNRVTLPNGNQRLHVNIVRPQSPVIKAYADDKFRVVGALKVSNDEMELHLDGFLTWILPLTLTLSGGTGQWAALNGSWTCTNWSYPDPTVPGLPYQDGRTYNMERCRITSAGAFSGITTAWDFSQNIVSTQTKDWHYSGGSTYVPYHAQFSGNTYANVESHFMVLQAADDVDTPIAVADRSTASVDVAEFGTFLVASPKSAPPAATLAYSYAAGSKTHYVMGLTPGATYRVAGAGTGSISITANGTGIAVTASGAGLLAFTIDNPVPAISSLSPTSATAGGAAFTLTVNGTNFVSGSAVQWNGSNRTTAYVGATQVTAAITAADIATAGTASVTVVNPSPGGGTSNAQSFSINNPTPTLTSLSPSSATAGGSAFTLTANGSNFVSTSTVQWNGSSRATTFISSTQLTAAITAADIAAAGTADVTVVNPSPGGGTSNAQTFAINNPTSTLTLAVGLGRFDTNGGWVTTHAGKDGGFALQSWLHLPWEAYNATGGGVHVAVGDVDGDGLDEIVMGLGTGGGGWIVILDDSAHGYALLEWIRVGWNQYNASNGEVFPAVGDIDGDGRAEIIAGLGTGSQGWIEIFGNASTGYQHLAWRQVAWPAYNAADGTTHPAVGDLDGDGKAEIVLGLGSGGGGWIEVIQSSAGNYNHGSWLQVSWPAYNASTGTTYPAAGDIDGDGRAEIVIGLGQGSGGWVEFLDDKAAGYAHLNWFQLPWNAYDNSNGETHPAVGNLDADSRAEIVFGLGRFQGQGGWLFAMDDATANYATLGWFRIPWDAFSQDGGETFPALGRPR